MCLPLKGSFDWTVLVMFCCTSLSICTCMKTIHISVSVTISFSIHPYELPFRLLFFSPTVFLYFVVCVTQSISWRVERHLTVFWVEKYIKSYTFALSHVTQMDECKSMKVFRNFMISSIFYLHYALINFLVWITTSKLFV